MTIRWYIAVLFTKVIKQKNTFIIMRRLSIDRFTEDTNINYKNQISLSELQDQQKDCYRRK